MYWAIVTSTTVGYGDFYPTSSGGRFIAVVVAYAGILVLALPISVIGNNFGSAYDASTGSLSKITATCIVELSQPWLHDDSHIDEVAEVFRPFEALMHSRENKQGDSQKQRVVGVHFEAGHEENDNTQVNLIAENHAKSLTREVATKFSSILVLAHMMLETKERRNAFDAMIAKLGIHEVVGSLNDPEFEWRQLEDNAGFHPIPGITVKIKEEGIRLRTDDADDWLDGPSTDVDNSPVAIEERKLQEIEVLALEVQFVVAAMRKDLLQQKMEKNRTVRRKSIIGYEAIREALKKG